MLPRMPILVDLQYKHNHRQMRQCLSIMHAMALLVNVSVIPVLEFKLKAQNFYVSFRPCTQLYFYRASGYKY